MGSIFCGNGAAQCIGDVALPKLLWDFLLKFIDICLTPSRTPTHDASALPMSSTRYRQYYQYTMPVQKHSQQYKINKQQTLNITENLSCNSVLNTGVTPNLKVAINSFTREDFFLILPQLLVNSWTIS